MMKQIFLVALLAVAAVGNSAAVETKNLRRNLQDFQTLQDNIQTVLACVSNTVTNDPATTLDANDFLTCATNALQTMMAQEGGADPAAAMTDLIDCMGEAVGCDIEQLFDSITNNNGGAGAASGADGGVLGWLGGFFGGGGRRL